MNDTKYVVLSAGLAWLQLMVAASMRSRLWTPAGMKIGFGNRDDLPEASPATARADRAAKNMLENLVLFVAVFVAARAAGATSAELTTGCAIFFYARLLYFLVYVAGVTYVRTLFWAIALAGVAMVGASGLR